MAMRINAKQIAIAREEGIGSFYFSLKHQASFGPVPSPYRIDFNHTMNWEYLFKRTDITAANIAELNKHWMETYKETYTNYWRDAMTPKTLKQLEQKRKDYEAIKNFTKAFFRDYPL
jgi:hypothetical protein